MNAGKATRRAFSQNLARTGVVLWLARGTLSRGFTAPAIIGGRRPQSSHGVASGDVTEDSAVIWSRADSEARMVVEWSTSQKFTSAHRVVGPIAHANTDFTSKVNLTDLPAGQRVFYRVAYEDSQGGIGDFHPGSLVTASRQPEEVYFAWSGDTCGQGYGIDAAHGGLKTFASIRKAQPQFFIHSGDTIYADNPIQPSFVLPDGTLWKNIVTAEKNKAAETLAEFRGNHRYNLLDPQVVEFNSEVSVFAQWDDHEVMNNWYPGEPLNPKTYTERTTDPLADRSKQAFFEYYPIREHPDRRIYRTIRRGPLCEIFFLDLRSYRGPNNPNRQTQRGPETDFMGETQLQWLKGALASSTATWKIVCSDMPLGVIVRDTATTFENFANGDGPPLGRELEVAELLRHLKTKKVRNVVWLTADIHYAASHYYNPEKAQFTEFDGFWEFVSGPLHAMTVSPGTLDNTFGPEVRFTGRKPGDPSTGPWTPFQFFGTVRINPQSKAATVTHWNRDGDKLWDIELPSVQS
ncbi:MAG TPA: alkaline phosphatase D family protein [Candidatus Limnocylindria bacterium]|jgi:alkaline phosphatase D|nr:alkaline phosphatase D family protein [Candidatus Limnocylindria bacterium]